VKPLAAFALALLIIAAAPSARAADTPTLKLDLAESQNLSVDASKVPLEQLLNALGEQLNFTVDFSPLASRTALVSGKFGGDLDELLSDILRGTNYVARRGPQGIVRLVIIATGNAQPTAAPAAGNTAVAIDVKSPSSSAAAQSQSTAAAAAKSAPPVPAVPAQSAAGSDGPPGVVAKMLSAQASALMPVDPNAPAAPPTPGAQSLGVMTRVAQANVQALVAGLNAACIGPSCGH
jgi:hypothetical protein